MDKQVQDNREFQQKIAEKKEGWLNQQNTIDLIVEGISLRKSLLQEEVDELSDAVVKNDQVEILDAVIDIIYIALGTAHECGVLDKVSKAWDLVHRNNMTKLGADGKVVKNENGKVIKPSNYLPVDLKILF